MRPGEHYIAELGLEPHPEGGWYRRTWAAPAQGGERPAGSAIYYLLLAGEVSAWHRIDATEIWHFYAGDSLELRSQLEGLSGERGCVDLYVLHEGLYRIPGDLHPPRLDVLRCWQQLFKL